MSIATQPFVSYGRACLGALLVAPSCFPCAVLLTCVSNPFALRAAIRPLCMHAVTSVLLLGRPCSLLHLLYVVVVACAQWAGVIIDSPQLRLRSKYNERVNSAVFRCIFTLLLSLIPRCVSVCRLV